MASCYPRLVELTNSLGSKLGNEVLGTVVALLHDGKIENRILCIKKLKVRNSTLNRSTIVLTNSVISYYYES